MTYSNPITTSLGGGGGGKCASSNSCTFSKMQKKCKEALKISLQAVLVKEGKVD